MRWLNGCNSRNLVAEELARTIAHCGTEAISGDAEVIGWAAVLPEGRHCAVCVQPRLCWHWAGIVELPVLHE